MARKTIEISTIVEKTNNFLKDSHPSLSIERKAIAQFTADILRKTKNYQGFNYLESESNIHGGHWGQDGRIFFYHSPLKKKRS